MSAPSVGVGGSTGVTTLAGGHYIRTLAETLDALPEQVVRYRLRDLRSCTAMRRGPPGTT